MDPLTVKEVADLLKLSLGAVYALCKAGKLPHHRLGQGRGAIRIDRQDLLAYVQACKTGAAPVARSGPSQPGSSTTAGAAEASRRFRHVQWSRLPDSPPGAGGRS